RMTMEDGLPWIQAEAPRSRVAERTPRACSHASRVTRGGDDLAYFTGDHAASCMALPVHTARSMRPFLRSAALLSLVVVAACSAQADDPAAETENIGTTSAALEAVTTFGTNPAQLKMF